MERCSRRDLLRATAGVTAVVAGASGVSGGTVSGNRVTDVDGRPVGGVEVDVFLLFVESEDLRRTPDGPGQTHGGRWHVASTTTATESDAAATGSFSIDLSSYPPRDFPEELARPAPPGPDPYVVVTARHREVVEPGGGEGREGVQPEVNYWFGTQAFDAQSFPDETPVSIELNSRRLYHRDLPSANVHAWHRIDTSGSDTDHYVVTEAAGDIDFEALETEYDEDPTEEDLDDGIPLDAPETDPTPWTPYNVKTAQNSAAPVTKLQAGVLSLQTPEDIEIDYLDPQNDDKVLKPWWSGPRFDSDAWHPAQMTVIQGYESDWSVPTYAAFGPDGADQYRFYDEEEARPDNALFGFKIASTVLSALSGYVAVLGLMGISLTGAGVVLFAAGLALSAAEADKERSFKPNDLPEWVQNSDVIGVGSLPVDHDRFDFTASGWRYPTYAAVQRVPIEFTGEEPAAKEFCIRGLLRLDALGYSDPQGVQLEHSFAIDPRKQSPLDPEGREPEEATDPGEESGGSVPPNAVVTASDYTPELGQTVRFDASGSRIAGTKDVLEYEWFVDPPADDPGTGISADGPSAQLTPEALGPYVVGVRVTDTDGLTDTARTVVTLTRKSYGEVPPVATDAGGECTYPPTGETFRATGRGATSHFGYGCGQWKAYEVVPFETYTVASTVDGCADCLLYDGAYAVEEPAGDLPEGADPSDVDSWEEVLRIEDPKGKAFAGQVHEAEFEAQSRFVRIRNVDGNSGKGFYAELFGPNPAEGEP